jgi:hypothetical protein
MRDSRFLKADSFSFANHCRTVDRRADREAGLRRPTTYALITGSTGALIRTGDTEQEVGSSSSDSLRDSAAATN